MGNEVVAHAHELAQMTVVREYGGGVLKTEQVRVGLRDHLLVAVGHTTHVRDKARRGDLDGEVAQVLIEGRQRRDAIDEGSSARTEYGSQAAMPKPARFSKSPSSAGYKTGARASYRSRTTRD